MSTAPDIHVEEDRLLELAYGELSEAEARAAQAHVERCPRCTQALKAVTSLRGLAKALPQEEAPDAGLASLLAYAEQSARKVRAGPVPKPSLWRRWLLPVAGAAALSVFAVIAVRVNDEVSLRELAVPEQAAPKVEATSLPTPAPAPQASAGGPLMKAADEAPKKEHAERKRASLRGGSELARNQAPRPAASGAREEGLGAGAPRWEALPPASPPLAEADDGEGGWAKEEETQERKAKKVSRAEPSPVMADAPKDRVMARSPGAAAPAALAQENKGRAEAFGAGAARPQKEDSSWRSAEAEARGAAAEGNRAAEAQSLRQALAGAPLSQRPELWLRLCAAQFALGQIEQARDACQRVQRDAPGSSWAHRAKKLEEANAASLTPAAPVQ